MPDNDENVDERISRLENELRELKKQRAEDKSITEERKEKRNKFSRRGFMKTAAMGAAGLGMMSAASGLSITSNSPVEFFKDSTSSSPDGEIEAGKVYADNISSGGTTTVEGSHAGNYQEVVASGSNDHENINNAISKVAGNLGYMETGVVELAAGEKYQLNGSIKLEPGVILTSRYCHLVQNTDARVIEMAPQSHISGGKFIINVRHDGTRRSANIVWDDSNGKMAPKSSDVSGPGYGDANAHFLHWGDQGGGGGPSNDYEGAAIRLKASADSSVTNCYLGRHTIDNHNVGMLADANLSGNNQPSGFLNNNWAEMEVNQTNVGLVHRGTVGAKIQIRGHFQAMERYYAKNMSGNVLSYRFEGHLEDNHRVGQNLVEGAGLKMQGKVRSNFSGGVQDPDAMGPGTTLEGVGYESGSGNPNNNSGSYGKTPTNAGAYFPGEAIHYKDNNGDTHSGMYMKGFWEGKNPWIPISKGDFIG